MTFYISRSFQKGFNFSRLELIIVLTDCTGLLGSKSTPSPEVPVFARIVWVFLVEVGGPDLWTILAGAAPWFQYANVFGLHRLNSF
jgi:hypothetical protein